MATGSRKPVLKVASPRSTYFRAHCRLPAYEFRVCRYHFGNVFVIILLMQFFRVAYREISHEWLDYSLYLRALRWVCVHKIKSWVGHSRYTKRKHCITVFFTVPELNEKWRPVAGLAFGGKTWRSCWTQGSFCEIQFVEYRRIRNGCLGSWLAVFFKALDKYFYECWRIHRAIQNTNITSKIQLTAILQ